MRQAIIGEVRTLFSRAQYPAVSSLAAYLERYCSGHRDLAGMAHAHLFLGNARGQMGDYDTAIAEYGESASLAKEAGYTFALYAAATATGIVEQIRGNYRKSIGHHQSALKIAETSGNPDWIATVQLNLAVAYHESGDNRRSLECYERVRQLKPGDPEWEPYVLGNLAGIYSRQGDTAVSLEYSRKALRLWEVQHFEREAVTALNNIGEAQRVLGRYPEAVATFQDTLRRSERLGLKKGKALAWNNLGQTYELQGNPVAARAACQNSLGVREEIGDQPGLVESLLCLSRLSLAARNYPAALLAGERATKIARATQTFRLLWEPLLLTGRANQALGKPVVARTAFEESIFVIESLRDQVVGEEREKQQFFEDKVDAYYALVDLLLGMPLERVRWHQALVGQDEDAKFSHRA